ncbi:MAG: metal ABC transporter permease [Candidatus Micrarchaeota archaeon]|nr:metal ABC transporter permease [Candidatus Micrarchaeota archaeon]
MLEFLAYSFGQRALLAGLLVALTCSSLGLFLVLRRLSLISDGLGHVAFGGIAFGFWAGIYPLYAAAAAVIAGAFGIHALRKARIHSDTAIAILFSVGLAAGVVLIGLSHGAQADLLSYLFGTLLGVDWTDVALTVVLGLAVLAALALLFKEWFFITFDSESAQAAGLPVERLELLFTLLTGLAVVVSAKVVGILLVTSLMVVPTSAAILLRLDFKRTLLISNILAVAATLVGLELSFAYNLAPGGSIVLVSAGFFIVCLAYNQWRASPASAVRFAGWSHKD